MTPIDSPSILPPAVEVRGLHFHYDTSDGQIHDIRFAVAPGQCAALVGPNGAGKSTVLLHFNGILPESFNGVQPTVFIHGQPVGPKTLDSVRRQVGLLFQDPDDQLFCATVFEDVAFGPAQFGLTKPQIASRVSESLTAVGLDGFEKRSPHRLSGGEKRRACLAGVLACRPSILALDEPTNGLDPRGRRELIALLRNLPATKIIATHDLDLVVQICSHTILLDAGGVVAQGPTSKILGDEPLMLAHGLEMPAALRSA
jgi:energy-coupling factor transporter ATP-binding protein EcfA2